MKKLMILGAGTYQVPLIQTAKKMGLYTVVVSIPGEYQGFQIADRCYELDTRDKEGILAVAQKERIDGICTSGTDVAVATIGYVCRQMGLSGISMEAAEIVTDKAKMKEAFLRGGVSAAEGIRAYSVQEAKAAAKRLGYPVVVKRVDSSGSRGITVVKKPDEIDQAFSYAREKSLSDYVLVEEFLKGVEIGADGFVLDGRLVFLAPHGKFIYQGRNITVPMGHEFPYYCSEKLEKEIARQMQLAVTATGVDHCSVNADLFVEEDRVSVIEMGGRTGATCIPELISRCYGINFYEQMIRSALGEAVDFKRESQIPCMAKLLLSPVSGTITHVDMEGIRALEKEGAEIALDFPVGHHVFAMADGTDRIGHVIASVEKEEELDELISRIRRCICIDGRTLEDIWNE